MVMALRISSEWPRFREKGSDKNMYRQQLMAATETDELDYKVLIVLAGTQTAYRTACINQWPTWPVTNEAER
jgi:hypothetical protein